MPIQGKKKKKWQCHKTGKQMRLDALGVQNKEQWIIFKHIEESFIKKAVVMVMLGFEEWAVLRDTDMAEEA